MIALKNAADADAVKKTIDAHVQNRVAMYKQYDPSQTNRAEEAMVFTSGRYVVLIISEKQHEVKSAFDTFIKE